MLRIAFAAIRRKAGGRKRRLAGPSAVVRLNRAVALGMRDRRKAGLDAVAVATQNGALDDSHLA